VQALHDRDIDAPQSFAPLLESYLVSHFGEILDYEHKLVVVDITIGLLDRGTRFGGPGGTPPILACHGYHEARDMLT